MSVARVSASSTRRNGAGCSSAANVSGFGGAAAAAAGPGAPSDVLEVDADGSAAAAAGVDVDVDADVECEWFAEDERYALQNRLPRDSTVYEKYVVDIQHEQDEQDTETKGELVDEQAKMNSGEDEEEEDENDHNGDQQCTMPVSASSSDLFLHASFGELQCLKIVANHLASSSTVCSSIGAILAVQDSSGMSLLHSASHGGHLPIFRWILCHLDLSSALHLVCCLDHSHRTIFHYLSGCGHIRVLRFLFHFLKKKDAAQLFSQQHLHRLLNVADLSGMTALHWAERHGFDEASKLLIFNGAEMRTRDAQGNTAVAWMNTLQSTHSRRHADEGLQETQSTQKWWKEDKSVAAAHQSQTDQKDQSATATATVTAADTDTDALHTIAKKATPRKSVKFVDGVENGENNEDDDDEKKDEEAAQIDSSKSAPLQRNIDPLEEETAIYSSFGSQTMRSDTDNLRWVQHLATAAAPSEYFRQRRAEQSEGDESDISEAETELQQEEEEQQQQEENEAHMQDENEKQNQKRDDDQEMMEGADEFDDDRSTFLLGDSDEDEQDEDADEKRSLQMHVARREEMTRARAAAIRR